MLQLVRSNTEISIISPLRSLVEMLIQFVPASATSDWSTGIPLLSNTLDLTPPSYHGRSSLVRENHRPPIREGRLLSFSHLYSENAYFLRPGCLPHLLFSGTPPSGSIFYISDSPRRSTCHHHHRDARFRHKAGRIPPFDDPEFHGALWQCGWNRAPHLGFTRGYPGAHYY